MNYLSVWRIVPPAPHKMRDTRVRSEHGSAHACIRVHVHARALPHVCKHGDRFRGISQDAAGRIKDEVLKDGDKRRSHSAAFLSLVSSEDSCLHTQEMRERSAHTCVPYVKRARRYRFTVYQDLCYIFI